MNGWDLSVFVDLGIAVGGALALDIAACAAMDRLRQYRRWRSFYRAMDRWAAEQRALGRAIHPSRGGAR